MVLHAYDKRSVSNLAPLSHTVKKNQNVYLCPVWLVRVLLWFSFYDTELYTILVRHRQ